jgi:2-polyprenyl-3-methyl-5-hydroxy-6-metoxy-1,4-benzoquinol methylase
MIMKKRLFLILARLLRACLDITETLLGIFVPKDRISERYLPRYQQQEVWKREYQIWETNRNEFLAKALPRACPSCDGSDSAFLWNSEDGYQYVQCRECDFVYVTPYFSYDLWREYFKRFEKDTEEINRAVIDSRFEPSYLNEDRQRFSFYLDLLKKYKTHGAVLDIGCLTGSFLKFARERGYAPFGIEYRKYAIESAKKRFDLNIRQGFFEEQAPSMIADTQRFDIITLWETLEHMLYPDAVIKHTHQLLRPDGVIAITVPNYDNLQVRILRERCFHCLGGPGNAGHINMFTPTTLTSMLERNDFQVLFAETEGSSSYFDLLAYLSGRFELINSYSNTFMKPGGGTSHRPFYFAPAFMNFALAFSPLLKLLENASRKGAIITAIARKKG